MIESKFGRESERERESLRKRKRDREREKVKSGKYNFIADLRQDKAKTKSCDISNFCSVVSKIPSELK